MVQRTRTRLARANNEKLGIIVTTVTLPEDDRRDVQLRCAWLRVQHMADIINKGDMEGIRLIAQKRVTFNFDNGKTLKKIDALRDEDTKAEIKILMEAYKLADERVKDADYEYDSYEEIETAKAWRVVYSHHISYLLGELV